MRRSRVIALVALFSALAGGTASAQTPSNDSTGFRAGQWGAEFSIGSNLGSPTGAGLLRFSTPRRALLVDVLGQVARQSGGEASPQTQSNLRLRLGSRWYRPVSNNVLQSLTLGVLASRDRRELQGPGSIQGPTTRMRSTSTGGGVFAELGGGWMVTPQFSVGAAWQGSVLYARGAQRTIVDGVTVPVSDERTTLWNAALGGLVLRAGVFF